MAFLMNEQTENIGARRLHTILEKLLEDISFNIPDMDEEKIVIDQTVCQGKVCREDTSGRYRQIYIVNKLLDGKLHMVSASGFGYLMGLFVECLQKITIISLR